jgi:hypothetical protein
VRSEKLQFKKGQPVYLMRENGKVRVEVDLNKTLEPIITYQPKTNDLRGAVIIYEYPVQNAPRGLYKIGYDPYRQDLSCGVSLGAILVYKGVYSSTSLSDILVAEYTGRPNEADDVNRIASMLADLYNTEVMHENEVTHVKNYFRRIRRLDQLAFQPDRVISANIKHSTVARVYGCHLNDKLKDGGEKYVKDWLLQVRDYDEHDTPITTIDTINSERLLEELILYNRRGNFDQVCALFQIMFQIQEEELHKDYALENGQHDMNEIRKAITNTNMIFY